MILPQTYTLVLIVMALGFLCLGSWANTFKLAGQYRFELYYLDLAAGCLVMALLFALSVGSMGFDGFSFLDDLEHAMKRQWLFAFVAGIIFNLGNMLLMSAVAVSGMAVAFSSGIAMTLIMSSLLSFLIRRSGNFLLIASGCLLFLAVIIVVAIANNILGHIQHEALARSGKAKSTRRPTSVKGVLLAVIGGLLMGCFSPLMQKASETEVGLGPYSLVVLFVFGLFFSSLVFSIFFMNLPVQGHPVEIAEYFRAPRKHHLLGVIGGMLLCAGLLAVIIANSPLVPSQARLGPGLAGALSQGYPLLAMLWGLLVWREFREGDARVKFATLIALVLFAGGVTLISIAPLYGHRVAA
jgi:glucose uptake protein